MTERGFFLWFAHSKKHHVYMFKDAVGFPSSKKKSDIPTKLMMRSDLLQKPLLILEGSNNEQ
jgi:uncharacterized protein involved in type VI secretion and phage assembly